MRTVGIIVEYNPLHNGHVYHYEQSMKAAKADACIAVMSGPFLQRGEPALASKWARTEMALRMGADIVIELPVAYACQPAEWFAYGAVSLLDATGVTDSLCFGSEDGRIEPLLTMADQLHQEPSGFRVQLQEELKKGLSYPAAYAAAAAAVAWSKADEDRAEAFGQPTGSLSGTLIGDVPGAALPPALNQPNNILGLHYLMALNRLRSSITPLTIAREKAGYHDTAAADSTIASATTIRRMLADSTGSSSYAGRPTNEEIWERIAPYVPSYTLDILRREQAAGRGPLGWENFASPLFSRLLSSSETDLARYAEVTEGLEHRIKRCIAQIPPAEEQAGQPVECLLQLLKTKRYTRTKLQRTLLRILLQHPKEALSRQALVRGPSCLRILGFSANGRHLLKEMKRSARLPVVTQAARYPSELDMDIRAASVYSLGYRDQQPDQWLQDYYQAPIRV